MFKKAWPAILLIITLVAFYWFIVPKIIKWAD